MNRTLWLGILLVSACSRAERDSVVATGTLEAVEVDVAPLAQGRVIRVLVNEGDSVRPGDTVAVLAQPTSHAVIEQSHAQVEATRANLNEAQNGPRAPEIKRAEDELNAATAEVARTTKDLERARILAAKGNIPLQQRDAAEAAAHQAIARRDAARQSFILLRTGTRPARLASTQP